MYLPLIVVKLLKEPIRFSLYAIRRSSGLSVAPSFVVFGGKDMANDKLKDMSIFIYIMHMMENCTELNEVVKNDMKEIRKYFNSNLNIEVKNIAFDAKVTV